jgi:putative membrane protein
MHFFLRLFVHSLAVFITAYITPGVNIASFWIAVIVAVVLGVLNAFLKPILIFLTFPINILTLGLFTLVINTLLILLTSSLVRGFEVEGFFSALIFGIILTLVNWFLSSLQK